MNITFVSVLKLYKEYLLQQKPSFTLPSMQRKKMGVIFASIVLPPPINFATPANFQRVKILPLTLYHHLFLAFLDQFQWLKFSLLTLHHHLCFSSYFAATSMRKIFALISRSPLYITSMLWIKKAALILKHRWSF